MARYLSMIEAGLAEWGHEAKAEYAATTPAPGLPVVEGGYVFAG